MGHGNPLQNKWPSIAIFAVYSGKKNIIKKKSKTKNKKSLSLVSLGQNHQNRLQLSGMEEGWKLVFQEHGFSEIWEIA